eukprot:CAMPEP_0184712504 /NCGR_PEP_ID=MMETSP0314-20130426/3041_1 /TAXON_ID=38298 /ORGANISM="Rhodella maculata, Strain CCMP 736" /LENGTH=76 /DNA_ID=CAMNT_0027174963 /DNA_START=23 /DNA_END=249 /DNA_ORIENTATION=-
MASNVQGSGHLVPPERRAGQRGQNAPGGGGISVEKVVSHDGHPERPGDYYEEESKTCVDVSIVHVKSSASLLQAAK